jgi:hypothetical protein
MKTIRNILLITLPSIVILLVILEIFFRIVIPATDPPMGHFYEEEKIFSLNNSRKEGLITIGRFAEMRSRWHINNMGWNYPIDYIPVGDRKLIAVIGDSYIEAFQVDANENYSYKLREMLKPEYEVYAFGKSGASLSQYLHMSRYASRHFDPDILIFNIVHNDFDESIRNLYPNRDYFMQVSVNDDGSFSETTPKPDYSFPQYTRWKRIVYKSALFRYLDINLKLRQMRRNIRADSEGYEANIRTERIERHRDLVYDVTEYLVKKMREENSDRRIIFVFDAPKARIYDGTTSESPVLWMHDMMEAICSKNDVEYIDLIPLMQEDYRINGKKYNSDLDGHWDEYGHEFVAHVLFDSLSNTD